ncbi:MAG: efflux transporter periplasmic adaptor subunit, partial [Bacteroidetes bacterium]|nr:efflux transporter periplasmic adaptor subunit [Bacteroidota bacterium]
FDIVDYEGKLLSIGRSIEKNTTLVPVYFEFTNPDNILPGSFASVYLKIPKQEKKLIVPIEALIETQGNYALIVQLEGELYSKRDVKIGASDGQMVEILDGLKAGEVIVTTGAYRVYLASMASDLPAHAHVH